MRRPRSRVSAGRPTMQRPAQATRLSALRTRQPEGRGPARRAGPQPSRSRRALARLERTEGTASPHHRRDQRGRRVRLDAARAGVRTYPTPCKEPFVPLLWLQVHELLGRVPHGSTAAVPPGRHAAGLIGARSPDTLRRRGCTPGGDLFEAPTRHLHQSPVAGPRLPAPDDHVAVPGSSSTSRA